MAWTIPYSKLLKHLKTIDDHLDVQIVDPIANEALRYNTVLAKWVNMSVPPRAATRVVAASDAEDTTNADYVCDGVDDQEQINQAILDLPTAGGRVLLSEGTFNLSGSVSILKSNVCLQGQGTATKLFVIDGANVHGVTVGDEATPLKGIIIRDMLIDGNRYNQTAAVDCLNFLGASGALIEDSAVLNVHVYRGYRMGLRAYYTPRLIVAGCVAYDCRTSGFDIYYQDDPILFLLVSKDAGIYGYRFGTVKRGVLSSCIAINAGTYGLMLSGYNCTVVGCVFDGGGYGISFTGTFHTITGNAFFNGTQIGIDIGGSRNTITGNTIYHYDSHGIYIYSHDENIISSNIIRNNLRYGVYIATSYAVKNMIHGNIILANIEGAIYDAGTATLKADNITA